MPNAGIEPRMYSDYTEYSNHYPTELSVTPVIEAGQALFNSHSPPTWHCNDGTRDVGIGSLP